MSTATQAQVNTTSNVKVDEEDLEPFHWSTAAYIFEEAFKNATPVSFNPKWSNGTGYFDHATYGETAPKLGNGRVLSAVTPGGRKILIIGTRLGNVVVFSRYDDWEMFEDPVFVSNVPTCIKHAFNITDGRISRDGMVLLLGDSTTRNIGHRIEDIYSLCKKTETQ